MPNPELYTVGWICALDTELVAALAFLDEEHDAPDHMPINDNNSYTLGRIGKHNVVITVLPHRQYGLVNAATAAKDLARSFPNVRIGLMVGIGGGAPSAKHDIRLGDIVVSSTGHASGGVFQYDYGKTLQDEEFITTGHLNQPPQFILATITTLKARYESNGHGIEETINNILKKKPRLRAKYQRPAISTDKLYISSFKHRGSDDESCAATCGDDHSNLVFRAERTEEEDNPAIHYGLIASANQVMKNASIRDKLSAEKDVLCFEMEAAGLMNHFPCIVIRGICDYSDTHKNGQWQGYAAMAAAAYAKDLLNRIAPNKIEAAKKLSEVLPEVNEKLKDIHSTATNANTIVVGLKEDSHSERVRKWLSPPDPSTNFNKALEQRHHGSGQWFVGSEEYSTWKAERNSFLWLHGIPGCGKTILSSTIVEDLQTTELCSSKLLYFYFDFNETQKQSVENAIRSLISQLYEKRQEARHHLDTLYSSCGNGQRQPSNDSLQSTFQDMVQQADEVWVVLDALDECHARRVDPNRGLLPWIQALRGTQMNIHLLVTSRPEQDIKSTVESWARNEEIIPIQSDGIADDIRAYVRARVRQHAGLSRWKSRPDVRGEIEDALLNKADGMFRWVSCQLDVLEDCLDQRAVRNALASLPKTLDETYARILAKIPDDHKPHTKRILQFLTYSARPLKIDEAVDALAVDIDAKPRFDPKNRMPDPEEMMKYCSSLVVVVRRQDTNNEKAVPEIQLAHFSVKEYLVSTKPQDQIATDLDKRSARASIAQVCLSYLLEINSRLSAAQVRQSYTLAQYAAQFWRILCT
ncbi:hypothetical protein M406DRAFT_108504 [Cryphonectria parasitica EP155]|uniref:NACHT domain-containing protein n=1 Tax=Cryphonectria parasitica (strain ATCC 38755 / EP155) TaxID=660469 RepID=A0A9P4XYC7_CRYP1|nr:uncharacterized protein M406DRAFT_108504 [Cryphonectria parasitica EP155]KAF3763163.1 hypothetical protein M406DRAFT_108504 [Cryphonectria parasitica EP155]